MATTRSIFNVSTVEIDVCRFDELIRKEEKLNIIEKIMKTDGLISIQILNAILECGEESYE